MVIWIRNEVINLEFFIISWFVVGFISLIGIWMVELRGKHFNKNYLEYEYIMVSILIFLLGYISPLIICAAYPDEDI